MTNNVITSIEDVTTQWLTSTLFNCGAISHGEVLSLEVGAGQGNWSTSANLSLKYTDEAKGELPHRLFLKMANTDLGDGETFGDSEVTYYTRDYADLSNAPLVRCYDAKYSQELKRYHVLLDDVSETHIEAHAKKPTIEYGIALVDGLAVLHAHWWGRQRLLDSGAHIHDARHIRNFVEIAEPGMGHIVERYSAELKPHWAGMMRELYAEHPRELVRRSQDLNGFTLIHGDVGSANVLVPRNADHPIYIIDRQPFNWSLTTWLGVYDLAYAIVLDWDIGLRRQYEIPLLKHYHKTLIRNGISNYDWNQLF